MDEELDLVTFEDDEGNEITMEVLDYFFYEGKQYALLTIYDEEAETDDEDEVDTYIMEVVPVGEDEEEFVMVPEDLEEKLIELVQNGMFGDDEFDDDEE